jgi:hypothetical protein
MKKVNNKILIIALLTLLSVFILSKVFRGPGREGNLDAEIFKVDTSGVTEITLQHANDSTLMTLTRNGNDWTISHDGVKAKAERERVRNMLGQIATLKTERIISRKKEKWDQYEVGDATSMGVSLKKHDNDLLKLNIGKETGGVTYARVNNRDEIFALDGYLQNAFSGTFADWRDHTLLDVQKNNVTKLNFQYPSDSGFVIEKKGAAWIVANGELDSVKFENYLADLRALKVETFTDSFTPANKPDVTLTITNGLDKQVTVKGWKESFDRWVLHSDLQPESYFRDDGPVIANKLFIGKKQLLKSP